MLEASWKAVSFALVRAFSVPEKAVGAFVGRLGHLQAQGLLGVRPGKGRALSYGEDLMHRLVFVCELFEWGLSPAVVQEMVGHGWEQGTRKMLQQAQQATKPGPADLIMYVQGARIMTGGWLGDVPVVESCPLEKLPQSVTGWMTIADADDVPDMLPPRAMMVNLSARLRAFNSALEWWRRQEAGRQVGTAEAHPRRPKLRKKSSPGKR